MSNISAMLEKTDWVVELQRKVFEECKQNDSEFAGRHSGTLDDVPVSVIISNIHRNFAKVPHFRQRTDFLEELRRSLQRVARNNHVNWYEFKDSSAGWFVNLLNLVQDDGNNNVRALSRSDAPTEDSEKDSHSTEERSCSEAMDDDYLLSLNQMDTIASSYSLNSSSMGCGTIDSTVESSVELDHIESQNIAEVDVNVRIRRYTEETANLREELMRSEELNTSLEKERKSLQTALDRITNKCTKLQKENKEQRDSLSELEQREESCKLDLRKLEKANIALQKRVEELEKQSENVSNLKTKIQELTNENSELVKQIRNLKAKYTEALTQADYLQQEYNELQIKNSQLEKSFERQVHNHEETIQELQNLNSNLKSKMNRSDSSSSSIYNHSTPYKLTHQDSLFCELKASGYNIDDSAVQELKAELSFYNEEIVVISQEVEEALQELAALRNEICIPSVQLVEVDGIQTLKHKVTTLVNMAKSCAVARAPPAPRMGDDSREKPDVLPQTRKTSNERLFTAESQENDLIGSVTSSMTSAPKVKTSDKSTSPLPEIRIQGEKSDNSETEEPEIIVPIVEALNRINDVKEADEDENTATFKRPSRIPRQRCIYTVKNTDNLPQLVSESSKSKALNSLKSTEKVVKADASKNAKGDGLHRDIVEIKEEKLTSVTTTLDMKTLKSESKDYTMSPDEIVKKIDTKYITIRPKPSEKTYTVSPVVSSSGFVQASFDDTKFDNSFSTTPMNNSKSIPRRKLSVYHRSFDVESLQTPDSLQSFNNEKRRSISTPDGPETDYSSLRTKSVQPLESCSRSEFMNSYRCVNTSISSSSPSPPQKKFLIKDDEDELLKKTSKIVKPVFLAPTKLKLPDSTVNQTFGICNDAQNSKTTAGQGILPKNHYAFGRLSGEGTEQSRILSSSDHLTKIDKNNLVNTEASGALESCIIGNSTAYSEFSNVSGVNVLSSSENSSNTSDNILAPTAEKNDKTYTKKIEDSNVTRKFDSSTATSASTTSAATALADSALEEISLHYSSSSSCGGGGSASVGGVDVVGNESSGDAPAVERAMSSGEDSSADSECDARSPDKTTAVPVTAEDEKKPPTIEVDSAKPALVKSNGVCPKENDRKRPDNVALPADKVEQSPVIIKEEKENSCQKINSNSSPQEVAKEDEKPKAFPSWTDEKLQESGIANFPDIDSEISESLTEEELKKKYTAFSVGLSTDRMTLSKRMILSRRYRDQAEKNFTNEVLKMQQDIKTARRRASIATISRPLMGSNQDISKELPRQRNSVSGRVPGLRRPSLCYEAPKWEMEKLDRTDSSSSIAELRDIFEQAESRRHSREENNNNLIRTSVINLSTITSERPEVEEVWSNTRDDMIPHLANDNEIHSLEIRQQHWHPLVFWLSNRYAAWKSMIWGIFIAFLLGFFINRVVSSSKRNGPPVTWWSIEEILNYYIQVENERHPIPRPI